MTTIYGYRLNKSFSFKFAENYYLQISEDGLSVMVIVIGNGINDLSSNPGQGYLFQFMQTLLGKAWIHLFSPPVMGK